MDFIIEAALEDLDQLAALFDEYRIFYGRQSDVQSGRNFIEDRIRKCDSKIFIAISADSIAGFVQLYPLYSSTQMKRLWLLNDLYIAAQYRGRGIGKNLINRCKEFCEITDACGLLLETDKTNIVGNKLYPLTGFKLDEQHNYYSWDNA